MSLRHTLFPCYHTVSHGLSGSSTALVAFAMARVGPRWTPRLWAARVAIANASVFEHIWANVNKWIGDRYVLKLSHCEDSVNVMYEFYCGCLTYICKRVLKILSRELLE